MIFRSFDRDPLGSDAVSKSVPVPFPLLFIPLRDVETGGTGRMTGGDHLPNMQKSYLDAGQASRWPSEMRYENGQKGRTSATTTTKPVSGSQKGTSEL